MLGLQGEDQMAGVLPARRVVDWYNGSLDMNLDIDSEFDLRNTERIAIIGNGNIACDMSRMMLRPAEDLKTSDAPEHVLATLRQSKVNCIEMVARRGVG